MKNKYYSLFMLIVLALLTLIYACSLQNPKAPQWDLPLNIPLVDSTFTLQELVKNTDDIQVLENGLVGFHYEGDFDTTKVGEQLTLPDVAHSYKVAFNTLEISVLAAAFGQYYFSRFRTRYR